MNKLKIAVLDNGADEKILALCGLPDIIQQNKEISVMRRICFCMGQYVP
ncbi:MAG: hypothetical protein ACLTBD_10685 [Clostridia bacterium]